MTVPSWLLTLAVSLFIVTNASGALAYDRTPIGSEISPPITTTLELADFGEGCAGADSWQNWYQRDDYSEIIGSASEARYSLPYTYEWTPEDATGTAAWIRADCMGPGGSTSSYTNDAFSWSTDSTSTASASGYADPDGALRAAAFLFVVALGFGTGFALTRSR